MTFSLYLCFKMRFFIIFFTPYVSRKARDKSDLKYKVVKLSERSHIHVRPVFASDEVYKD